MIQFPLSLKFVYKTILSYTLRKYSIASKEDVKK